MIDELTSFSLRGAAQKDLSTGPVRAAVKQSSSRTGKADRSFRGVRIIELVGGRKIGLEGDYHFQQLPVANDQIIVRNRRGSYDIMRVSHTAHEGDPLVYVRWIARR